MKKIRYFNIDNFLRKMYEVLSLITCGSLEYLIYTMYEVCYYGVLRNLCFPVEWKIQFQTSNSLIELKLKLLLKIIKLLPTGCCCNMMLVSHYASLVIFYMICQRPIAIVSMTTDVQTLILFQRTTLNITELLKGVTIFLVFLNVLCDAKTILLDFV